MKKVKRWIDLVLLTIGSILIIFLVVAAIWQVFTRFVLEDPSIVTQEILRFSLIWVALIGAAYAFGQDEHLSLTFLRDKITGQAHKRLRWFIDMLVIVFALFVFVIGGYNISQATMAELSPILNMPMGLVYGILPICGTIIIFYQLIHISERREIERTGSFEKGEHTWM
ncbi:MULTISPECIES: TRAP transporter small permease [Virgibacillus]|uniref:2,3-diketo-L-gulonate TRAP transporter small permease protein YiaM n=2 Tax=Virgibacillus TaxID=84406 RepID=A0A024Q6C8_9BACI|nr:MULTISPECIES: TRAP transporter small permease [Virgibacillus]EQB38481.1 C4-dicarboxylate ABC transporter [Virgibacillus sp. CM-4]MYL41187.1 TRAP transporter small permease subunit [Virgibacillus massiliensis]GGJ54928.1 C4-dicarboxylate ABC transporter permease [Virgibacillus kapii]CDQ38009.1 2,3-diketo-L-gulonate TRAP transporter small permease protein YiaM [Virgibacillus massiliensis]